MRVLTTALPLKLAASRRATVSKPPTVQELRRRNMPPILRRHISCLPRNGPPTPARSVPPRGWRAGCLRAESGGPSPKRARGQEPRQARRSPGKAKQRPTAFARAGSPEGRPPGAPLLYLSARCML